MSGGLDLAVVRRLLCERLQRYLEGLESALRKDVRLALAMEGKVLHEPEEELDGRWALLPFCLFQNLRAERDRGLAEFEAACDVSLAMECVVCATDLLDDVMDDDTTTLIEQLGIARVLNVALTLVSLSQRMLLALLELNLPITLPVRLMDLMQRAILLASAGQQQDLLAERRAACELTREECLEIAAAKAGALLSLACQMGALCASVGEVEVERCAEVGRLLGMAAQLDNDAHDLAALLKRVGSGQRGGKSDLARGKKTLPVVLAAHVLRTMEVGEAHSIDFRHLEWLAGGERESYLKALHEGIFTTWGLALLYRERAREVINLLLGERSISPMLMRVLGLGAPVSAPGEAVLTMPAQ